MSTNSVGAVCIHVTVMVAGDAFVDIYKLQTINKELFNFCYKVVAAAVEVHEFTSILNREEINRIKTLVILKGTQK